ncbi:MAG TPA: YggS family pyridoxal phosphate-dependent enzyme [Kiritimatiellia bacterium]|nr:YggS family pyridoxal phosphate-dependent enzyme [Kiritimatiellia bacterium]HMP35271.1 YggS family pyridoxal phosphate-dependent enzyme [Kiritimatiellia bacterium]
MSTISDRIEAVQQRLADAIARSGRTPGDVSLMAVSKNHGPDAVREAVAAGLTLFGENRVQEAAAKIPEAPGAARWHLIGHLQRNKVRPAVEWFECIHSIDSWRLLEAIQQACEQAGRRMRILLEVNVSGEAVKFGFKPDEVPSVLGRLGELTRLDLEGLMTIPPLTEDPEGARPHFRRLRQYRDQWQQESGVPLPVLSMGMSHDLEVAVEEGSNVIRIGTAIFGPRPKPVRTEEEV